MKVRFWMLLAPSILAGMCLVSGCGGPGGGGGPTTEEEVEEIQARDEAGYEAAAESGEIQ